MHGQGLPTAPSAGTCAGAAAVAAVAGAALAAHAADTAQQGGGGLASAVQDSAAAAAAAATAAVGAQQEGVELAFTDEDQEALKAVAAATDLTQKKREDTSEWFLRAREVALQNQVCARAIQCRSMSSLRSQNSLSFLVGMGWLAAVSGKRTHHHQPCFGLPCGDDTVRCAS